MEKKFDRKQGIGGSDATRLYNGDWHDLYLEKIGEKEPDDLSNILDENIGGNICYNQLSRGELREISESVPEASLENMTFEKSDNPTKTVYIVLL